MKSPFSQLLLLFIFTSTLAIGQKSNNAIKIATYQNSAYAFEYTTQQINAAFNNARIQENSSTQQLGLSGELLSFEISDPEPLNGISVPYLVYVIRDSAANKTKRFGHKLYKTIDETKADYFINTDLLNQDNDQDAARAYKCSSASPCNSCKEHRTGFLGLGGVDHCDCTQDPTKICNLEVSGSGFPWGPIIGLIGVIISIIAQ